MSLPPPQSGDVVLAAFGRKVGREQAGTRPALVVSPAGFNEGPLVVCVPFTRTERGSPLHVRVEPPDGGLRTASYAMCDQVRAVSRARVGDRWGRVSDSVLREVGARLRLLIPEP